MNLSPNKNLIKLNRVVVNQVEFLEIENQQIELVNLNQDYLAKLEFSRINRRLEIRNFDQFGRLVFEIGNQNRLIGISFQDQFEIIRIRESVQND